MRVDRIFEKIKTEDKHLDKIDIIQFKQKVQSLQDQNEELKKQILDQQNSLSAQISDMKKKVVELESVNDAQNKYSSMMGKLVAHFENLEQCKQQALDYLKKITSEIISTKALYNKQLEILTKEVYEKDAESELQQIRQ